MRVESLRVRGLGGLAAEREFRFAPDLTVVGGGNESGKTTLAVAVHAALFGLGDHRRFLRADGPAGSELIFQAGGRRYLLRRDFRTGRAVLAEAPADTGKTSPAVLFDGPAGDPEQGAPLNDALEKLLGIGEGTAWLRTGMVLEGKLDTRLDHAVRAWISGSPRGEYETVLDRLHAERERICGASEAPGELAEVREELALRRQEAAEWEERGAALRAMAADCAARESDLQAAVAEASGQEERLQNLIRFEELTRDRARLEETLLQLRQEQDRIRKQVEAVEAATARLEKDFGEFLDAPGDLEECLQAWSEAVYRRADVRRDLERAEEVAARLPVARTRRNGGVVAAVTVVLGLLACLGAGAFLLGLVLTPLFGAVGYAAVWYLDRNTQRMRLSNQQELVSLAAELDEVDRREWEAKAGLGKLVGYGDPGSLRVEFKRYLQAQGALDRARSARDSHRPFSEVVDAYEEVFQELQILDTQTRDLVARARYLSGLDASLQILAVETEKTRTAVDTTRETMENLAADLDRIRADLARLEAETVSPGRLGEDVGRLERREAELTARVAALDAAEAALREAVATYHEDRLDRVAAYATDTLAALSLGRYSGVRFTESLELEARDAGQAWIPAGSLSRVTRDQLHLAVRLAAHDEAVGDNGLPVVLDGVFAGWDDRRLEAAYEVLRGVIASGRQVVVLGADPRLESWPATSVALDGPVAGKASKRRAA